MEKQKSTVIMRHANYKSKAKAQRSLTHSLRIKTKNFRPNEWAEELSAHTWISHPESGELIQLNTLTEAQKLEIRDSIIEDAFASKSVSPQIKSDYAKYLYKLKSKIASTEKPDKNGFINEALVTELMHIRDNNPEDFEQRIDAIEGVKRKKQLLTMLAKHHQLAKLVAGTEDQRTAKVHEAFFKFPHQHGVVPDPRRMAECLKDFYATHAPNHHVPLLVVHDDERIEGHQTGAHPHIFVDTEDTVTGERNLNQKLTEAVEKYLAFNPTTVHLWNPDTKEHEEHVIASLKPAKTQYVKAKLQGMILQDMFMQHTRKHFPELELDFTPERERKVRAYNEKYADGHKPKADRQYNLNGWLTEENERLGRELKHAETLADERKQELNETVSKLAESTAALGVASETLAINEATISQQQDNLRQLETTLQANHATIKQQGKKIDAQAKEIAGVSDELKQSKSKLMVANETIAKRHAENGKLEAQIRGQRARINKLKGEAEKGNKLIKAMNVKAKESFSYIFFPRH